MLDHHPQLCMSVPKEVHFFNDVLPYRNRIMEKNFGKGTGWYKMHFKHCGGGKLKGEITPRYSHDVMAPGRIKEHNKDVRILYCLRSPVERIESHYNFAKYFVGKEDRTMEQAIHQEPEFIEMSLYYRNLCLFLEHFPPEQIFLVWFEDIKNDPEGLLEKVYSFLGVDSTFRPTKMHEKSNVGRISKSSRLQDYIRVINHRLITLGLSGLIRRIKKAGLGNLIMKMNSKPLRKDKMTPELKSYIIDLLREDIRQLEKWTGKDLGHWLI